MKTENCEKCGCLIHSPDSTPYQKTCPNCESVTVRECLIDGKIEKSEDHKNHTIEEIPTKIIRVRSQCRYCKETKYVWNDDLLCLECFLNHKGIDGGVFQCNREFCKDVKCQGIYYWCDKLVKKQENKSLCWGIIDPETFISLVKNDLIIRKSHEIKR